MSRLTVNPGYGRPFLSLTVCNEDASDQAWITVRDITPAQLYALGEELARQLRKPGEIETMNYRERATVALERLKAVDEHDSECCCGVCEAIGILQGTYAVTNLDAAS